MRLRASLKLRVCVVSSFFVSARNVHGIVPARTAARKCFAAFTNMGCRNFFQKRAQEDRMPAKYIRGLKCRECSRHYDSKPVHVCEVCFGPLEVDYDYEQIAKDVSREKITARDRNMW